jgi:hypothetical protein
LRGVGSRSGREGLRAALESLTAAFEPQSRANSPRRARRSSDTAASTAGTPATSLSGKDRLAAKAGAPPRLSRRRQGAKSRSTTKRASRSAPITPAIGVAKPGARSSRSATVTSTAASRRPATWAGAVNTGGRFSISARVSCSRVRGADGSTSQSPATPPISAGTTTAPFSNQQAADPAAIAGPAAPLDRISNSRAGRRRMRDPSQARAEQR